MQRYIVYFLNEDGTKEKIISPAIDSFSAEQIVTRWQPLKTIVYCLPETDEQPQDADEYILS